MNAVLMEALRIFPPVPGGGPRLLAEDEEIAGRLVPKGVSYLQRGLIDRDLNLMYD